MTGMVLMTDVTGIVLLTDGNWHGFVPALNAYLTDKLPAFVTVQDPSLDVIALLRILHAFNNFWATVYEVKARHNIGYIRKSQ